MWIVNSPFCMSLFLFQASFQSNIFQVSTILPTRFESSQAHLLRRVYESLYITAFSSLAKKDSNSNKSARGSSTGSVHPLNAAVGLAFYTLASPSFALDSGPPHQLAAVAGVLIFAAGFIAQVLQRALKRC